MYCIGNCKVCNNLVISDSVSVITVSGVNTLVIDVPNTTFMNNQKVCLVVAQSIPDTATINMPVAVSIGGNTTTVYPIVKCDCTQVTACGIKTRTRYPLRVSTTATSAVFKAMFNVPCCSTNQLASIPAPTTAASTLSTSSVESESVVKTNTVSKKTTKTTESE